MFNVNGGQNPVDAAMRIIDNKLQQQPVRDGDRKTNGKPAHTPGETEDKEKTATISGVKFRVEVCWTGEWNGCDEVNYCHIEHLKSGLVSSLSCIMGTGYIDDQIELNDSTVKALEIVARNLGY